MKEGYPLSPTLFLVYYDVLLTKTLLRLPEANLYAFLDDITIMAENEGQLLYTLGHLKRRGPPHDLTLTAHKIEIY